MAEQKGWSDKARQASSVARKTASFPSTYPEAKKLKEAHEAKVTQAGAALKGYPKNAMGMTPDAVKFSPDYKAKKQAYDSAFSALRDVNSTFLKKFSKEYKAEKRR
jgi:hypothetical protein